MKTKKELIASLAEKLGTSKAESERVLAATLESLEDMIAEGGVRLHAFGTFTVKDVAAVDRRNPQTGATVHKPATRKIVFKAASELKERI